MEPISRRGLLGGLVTAAAAIAAPPAPAKRYGRINVNGHRAHTAATGETLHVFVDGRDVTRDCFLCDDVEGYARMFCRDEAQHRDLEALGAIHVSAHDGGVCALEVRGAGRVRIAPGAALV